jgi:hypothetical protein
MSKDLEKFLAGWVGRESQHSARIIKTAKGGMAIQYYEARAVTQMELNGRPDGIHPGGFATMLHQLQAAKQSSGGAPLEVTPQQWMELDREFAQFQQRRRAVLIVAAGRFLEGRAGDAVPLYQLAVHDAQHCLDIIDFATAEHPAGALLAAQPALRPAIIAQRSIALAQADVAAGNAEFAVERLKDGARQVEDLLRASGVNDPANTSCMRDLQVMECALRERFELRKTLREQLDEALAAENYELAASLRDRISQKGRCEPQPQVPTPH